MAMFFGGKKVDDPKFEFLALNFLTGNRPQPSKYYCRGAVGDPKMDIWRETIFDCRRFCVEKKS
jgi:hypothetical protein